MAAFFDMGGYAGYVWPAYAVSALALIGLGVYVTMRARAMRRRLDAFEKQSPPSTVTASTEKSTDEPG